MAPILRGAPLGSENERAIFAFFTLVSYIGPHAPYRQTQRGDSYKPYLEKLLADNKAYWRFCSAETLEEEPAILSTKSRFRYNRAEWQRLMSNCKSNNSRHLTN
jgi:glutamyl/glutaminyl-tRNA synthetase